MTGIKDVARRAGVSISTVSYVMSGKRSVRGETKRKVMQAARDLHYSPNAGARMLRGDRTGILALSDPIHPDTDYANYSGYMLEVAKRAHALGYDVLLLTGENMSGEIGRVCDSQLVDGVVLLDVDMVDDRVEMAEHSTVPYVSIGYPRNVAALRCVDLDFAMMGRIAIDKVAEQGHRTCLFFGPAASVYERGSNFVVRVLESLSRRARERGVTLGTYRVEGDAPESVHSVVNRAFEEHPDATAIIAQTGLEFLNNAIACVHESGRRIPQDVSFVTIATYGNADALTIRLNELPLRPAITCSKAVDMLVGALEGKGDPLGTVDLVAPEYIDRGSVVVPHMPD
jgi:DNA-binding LacI/PurR family transcriptional regulator